MAVTLTGFRASDMITDSESKRGRVSESERGRGREEKMMMRRELHEENEKR